MAEAKKLNLTGCQHLRKLLISEKVEWKGTLDLTDTPIKSKNNVYEVPRDKGQFKNVPQGVSVPKQFFNRVKLKVETAEMSTQTDPEIAPLGDLNLLKYDRETL